MSLRIRLINGPNLGRLGLREPERYGRETLDTIVARLNIQAATLGCELSHFQSDIEGELVRYLNTSGDQADGLILNPAAYTHTSVALRDAVLCSGLPCVEVHLTNVYQRETFRHVSLTAPVCIGQITGFGALGYALALQALVEHLKVQGSGFGIQ